MSDMGSSDNPMWRVAQTIFSLMVLFAVVVGFLGIIWVTGMLGLLTFELILGGDYLTAVLTGFLTLVAFLFALMLAGLLYEVYKEDDHD